MYRRVARSAFVFALLTGVHQVLARTFNVVVVFTEESIHNSQALIEAKQKSFDSSANGVKIEWKFNFERYVINCTSCGIKYNLDAAQMLALNSSRDFDGAIFLQSNGNTAVLSSVLNNENKPTIGLFHKTVQASRTRPSPYFTRIPTSPVQPYAYVMRDIIRKMGWTTIFLVASDNQQGLRFASAVQYFAARHKWKLYRTIWIDSSFDAARALSALQRIENTKRDAVLMHGRGRIAREFLKLAANYSFRNASFAWLLTEGSSSGVPMEYLPLGVITVKHKSDSHDTNYERQVDIICDAMDMFRLGLIAAVDELCGDTRTNSCIGALALDDVRNRISRYIRYTSFRGRSDEFRVLTNKDKPTKSYEIWNTKQDYLGNQYWSNVGLWSPSGLALDKLTISTGAVFEPYLSPPRPTLRVPILPMPVWLTVGNVHTTHANAKPEHLCVNGMPCYSYNVSQNSSESEKTVHCCAGTQIDLILLLERDLNFNAYVYFVPDGKWGAQDDNTSQWNGLMEELLTGKGDVTAFLGISSRRSAFVEFTQPYFTLGLNILVKKIKIDDIKRPAIQWNFLTPFDWDLWLMVVVSCNVVLVFIWMLDRMSPQGHRRRLQILEPDTVPVDNGFTLLDSMSYVWGVAFSKDIGAENTPRSPSARFVSIFFAFMALILVNTYCANLTAFLLKDNSVLPIDSIVDRKLVDPNLYPPDGFQLGVVKGSFEQTYFKNHQMKYFQELYQVNIRINLVSNYSLGFELLQKGKLDGLVGDDVTLQSLAVADDCSYSLIKKSFYQLGVAFAFPKGSPWLDEANLSVLKNQENGSIDQIKKLRFPAKTCLKQAVREFVIADFSGLFLTVAIVVGLGLAAVVAEVFLLIILLKCRRCLGRLGVILRDFILGVKAGEEDFISFRTIYNCRITEQKWSVNEVSEVPQTTSRRAGQHNNGFIVHEDFDSGFPRTLQLQRDLNDAAWPSSTDIFDSTPARNGVLPRNGSTRNGVRGMSLGRNKRHVHLEAGNANETESSRL